MSLILKSFDEGFFSCCFGKFCDFALKTLGFSYYSLDLSLLRVISESCLTDLGGEIWTVGVLMTKEGISLQIISVLVSVEGS